MSLLEQGDAAGSERWLRRVVELEPTYTPAWCRLGQALSQLGRRDPARQAWQHGPYDPVCLEALGRDLLEDDPASAARVFRTLSTRTSADPLVDLLIAQAVAADDPLEAVSRIDTYLELRSTDTPDLLPTVQRVVDALETEDARALLERVIRQIPELAEPLAADLEEREVEARAIDLMGAAPQRLEAEQRQVLADARRSFAAGDVATALARTEELANQAARSPEVWASLADLREASGDIEGAERALWLARRLDPLNADVLARHAEMLQDHFGRRFSAEAFAALDQAVLLQPTPALRWRHARLALEVGRVVEARQSLVSLAQTGPDTTEAQRLLEALDRVRAEPPVLPSLAPPDGVGEEAWLAVHRAQVWWERARATNPPDAERLAKAEAEVEAALQVEPDLLEAINLQAQIRWTGGDGEGARAAWTASLERRPNQPTVLARLAEVARQDGDLEQADELLVRAAEAGSGLAIYQLALNDFEAGRWWAARERLDRYFSQASSGRVHDQALALQSEVDRRFVQLWIAIGLSLAALLVFPAAWWWRRRSGVGIVAWLRRDPRAFRDVARIVSAIRHEVLKHNISSLPMVADAVEVNDEEVTEWAGERLERALEQLDRYILELEETAMAHGVVLNLRRRDPTFGPFLAAVERLRKARRRLQNRKTAPELREISEKLNQDAYRALGTLVDGICVLQLEPTLFDAAWATVCAESGEAIGVGFAVESEPLRVRMFRQDLMDVLVNLLRNGLAASEEEGREHMAVRVDTDEDPITGLLRAEIRVSDQVQKKLTTAMIRGRYIDRGLGLAVDLVSRAGGSVHVEKEPGWAKSVVVRLPMEET